MHVSPVSNRFHCLDVCAPSMKTKLLESVGKEIAKILYLHKMRIAFQRIVHVVPLLEI